MGEPRASKAEGSSADESDDINGDVDWVWVAFIAQDPLFLSIVLNFFYYNFFRINFLALIKGFRITLVFRAHFRHTLFFIFPAGRRQRIFFRANDRLPHCCNRNNIYFYINVNTFYKKVLCLYNKEISHLIGVILYCFTPYVY